MTLVNKRLKNYIHSNASSTIRSRAKDCKVISMSFPSENKINAVVAGSTGIKYNVSFSGVVEGQIESSCSCPFDHGNVCKHEVALAIETDAFFAINIPLIEKETPSDLIIKPKYSTTEPYILPLQKISEIDEDLIKKHCSTTVFREMNYNRFGVELINSKQDYIHLQIKESYWSDYYNVQVRKKEAELSILCNCRASNKNLCKHQVQALLYIKEKASHIFLSEEEIDFKKERLLKEYGFTLKNNSYKQYFSFEYVDGNLEAIPKKEGIVRLSKFKDFQSFKDGFLDEQNATLDQLPFQEKKPKTKKEFAVAFTFHSEKLAGNFVSIYALKGNSNKEKTDLVSKIEQITTENFLLNKDLYENEKHTAIIEKILLLNSAEAKSFGEKQDREKFYFTHLKDLIKLLDDSILVYNLEALNVSGNITKRNLSPINISSDHPKLFFKVIEEAHFYVLKTFVEIGGSKKQYSKNKFGDNFFFLKDKNTYYLHKSVYEANSFIYFREQTELRINKSDFDDYYQEFIQPLSQHYEVIINHKKHKNKKVEAADFKKQVYLSEVEESIILKPVIEYKEKQIAVLSNQQIEELENETSYKIQRNKTLENDFIALFKNLHPSFQNQDYTFFWIDKEDFIDKMWFLNAFELLEENNIEVFGFDKLSKMKYNPHKPSISMNINSGIDWFDVSIEIKFGEQLVSLKDVRKSVIDKSNYIRLKDGSIGILPEEWVQKYSHVFRSGDVKKDAIQVSKYQLSVIDSLYDNLDASSDIAINHLAIKKRLNSFKEISKVQKPKGLKATLRDYQKEGLNWLNFLEEYNFGGCLADDMGLGKTLQIITFLKYLKDTKKPKNATLIVLPTSLIFNWQEEIKKFCPSLKFLVHTGVEREKSTTGFDSVDIVFSTYGIVTRDVSFLKEYVFHYIILDESQAIKNPNSQRFKSVRLLQAQNKLVLTGTPIENNTFDLYAQMTFVNPGLLGTMANFKKEYATPIDKNKNTEVANDLRQLVNPFLLRRTKEQVATELPEKTEQILYCTMESEQRKLYDAYKNKYRDYLLNKINEDGVGKSKMYVLEGLTKLRQICDSPQLLNDDETYTSESIKIQELVRHITEKTGNHKILVFSQFVKMLNLVKIALNDKNIFYEYLDGSTKDRQERVDNFQNNDDVRVFLISLKAGGTGLNLTAADYVYLVDPWWNPAVEAQAIDRCYRIGQTKHVMAYKMICKETIEEKIINYQLGKKKLSEDIIQTDESFVKALSKEAITDLFS